MYVCIFWELAYFLGWLQPSFVFLLKANFMSTACQFQSGIRRKKAHSSCSTKAAPKIRQITEKWRTSWNNP